MLSSVLRTSHLPRALHTLSRRSMSNTTYTLYYWPSIPGRGEYVRMLFEAAHAPYTDNTDIDALQARVMSTDTVGHPPHFAPPVLGVTPAGGQEWFLSQTPAILAFLGPRLGLVGDVEGELEASREQRRAQVQQLTLTALDLMLEAHDTHHPIANGLYYEDQKDEAKRRSEDFRATRVPKFLKHFDAVIASNSSHSGFLVGTTLTTADLTLFHTLTGLRFSFPRLMSALEKGGQYKSLFVFEQTLAADPRIKDYLSSDRRRQFSNGLFRKYDELDGEA